MQSTNICNQFPPDQVGGTNEAKHQKDNDTHQEFVPDSAHAEFFVFFTHKANYQWRKETEHEGNVLRSADDFKITSASSAHSKFERLGYVRRS
jgi:hypothetical protein